MKIELVSAGFTNVEAVFDADHVVLSLFAV